METGEDDRTSSVNYQLIVMDEIKSLPAALGASFEVIYRAERGLPRRRSTRPSFEAVLRHQRTHEEFARAANEFAILIQGAGYRRLKLCAGHGQPVRIQHGTPNALQPSYRR